MGDVIELRFYVRAPDHIQNREDICQLRLLDCCIKSDDLLRAWRIDSDIDGDHLVIFRRSLFLGVWMKGCHSLLLWIPAGYTQPTIIVRDVWRALDAMSGIITERSG